MDESELFISRVERLLDTAQRGEWAAYDGRGRIIVVRKTKKLAREDGETYLRDYGTPERRLATERRERIAFLERLEALGD